MSKIRILALFCVILSVFVVSVFAVRPSGNRTIPPQGQQQQPAADESDSDEDMADEADKPEQSDSVPWAGLKADPNTIQEIENAWEQADRAAGSESRQATRMSLSDEKIDENINLIRASNRQVESELELLRLIAQAEGATRTVETIDRLMEQRQANMDDMMERVRRVKNQERLQEREERRQMLEQRRQERMGSRTNRMERPQRPERTGRPPRQDRQDDWD